MEDTDNEIIRSELSADFLEETPSWLVRWGTIGMALVIVLMFTMTWFISYPTIVYADFTLSTSNTPKPVVSKVEGYIEKLFVEESQYVQDGQMLAYIESDAKHEQVLNLERQLQAFDRFMKFNTFTRISLIGYSNLGEVQSQFQTFYQHYQQLYALYEDDYLSKRITSLRNDITELNTINDHLKDQYNIYVQDADLAAKEFEINQKLHKEKIISSIDFYREESKYLSKKIPLKNTQNTILSNQSLINAKQREILDLENTAKQQAETFKQSLNALKASITNWKNRYLLIAPIEGKIYLSGLLQEKQFFSQGAEILYIIPSSNSVVGQIMIPQSNFGRVSVGQKVLIKLQGYPFGEYGAIEGVISSIAQLPIENNAYFRATVDLPRGFRTNTNKQLSYQVGMTATAEIITEDLKLIERIFYNIRQRTIR